MSLENVFEYVKSNKKTVVKRSLIAAGITVVVTTVLVLLKKDRLMTEQYFIDNNQNETDMSIEDLVTKVVEVLPGVSFDYDNEGQVVIYTGKYRDENVSV